MTGGRDAAVTYLAIWVATLATTAIADVTSVQLVHAVPPRDVLHASTTTMLGLVAHNASVALWPLALVAIGWPAIPVARQVGDALVAGQLLVHGALVGDALAQQPGLWRFLPHLPVEWLALALPSAGWVRARRAETAAGPRDVLGPAVTSIAALVIAAGLETWAVPL